MFVVMTRVKLKPDSANICAKIFEDSNPELVANEPDWLGARMLFDPQANIVTVIANWKNAEAYQQLSSSEKFQNTMMQFRDLFDGPPEISINNLLVEMKPRGLE